MADYASLFGLVQNSDLRNKVAVAVGVAADGIRTESAGTSNHANRLTWAKQVFASPVTIADQVTWAVVMANNTATIAQIQNATDAAIQTNVDNVVDIFADGS